MSTDERPESLAAQAASWVPPWDRPVARPAPEGPAPAGGPPASGAPPAVADPHAEPVPQAEPSPEAEAEAEVDADADAEVEAPAPAEAPADADADASAEPEPEASAEPEPEASAEPKHEPEAEGEPEAAPVNSEASAAVPKLAADPPADRADRADPAVPAVPAVPGDAAAAGAAEVPHEGTAPPAAIDADPSDAGQRPPDAVTSSATAPPTAPGAARRTGARAPAGGIDTITGLDSDPAPVVDDRELRAALEAILLVVDEPVAEMVLAQVLEQPTERVAAMLESVSADYTAAGHGFDLRRAAGGWRLYTRPEYADYVERFVLDGQSVRLTQAALETLAVIAYKQPVSRSRISAIRGVNCDGVMRTLVSRGLVEECGTEPESGAFLYRTTVLFLEKLGLNSVDQLPPLAPFLPDDVEEVLDAQR